MVDYYEEDYVSKNICDNKFVYDNNDFYNPFSSAVTEFCYIIPFEIFWCCNSFSQVKHIIFISLIYFYRFMKILQIILVILDINLGQKCLPSYALCQLAQLYWMLDVGMEKTWDWAIGVLKYKYVFKHISSWVFFFFFFKLFNILYIILLTLFYFLDWVWCIYKVSWSLF